MLPLLSIKKLSNDNTTNNKADTTKNIILFLNFFILNFIPTNSYIIILYMKLFIYIILKNKRNIVHQYFLYYQSLTQLTPTTMSQSFSLISQKSHPV